MLMMYKVIKEIIYGEIEKVPPSLGGKVPPSLGGKVPPSLGGKVPPSLGGEVLPWLKNTDIRQFRDPGQIVLILGAYPQDLHSQ